MKKRLEIDKRNFCMIQRQYIQCFNSTHLLSTLLIFHLVYFLLSNITGFTRHISCHLLPVFLYLLPDQHQESSPLCPLHSWTSLHTISRTPSNLTNTLYFYLVLSRDIAYMKLPQLTLGTSFIILSSLYNIMRRL